MRGRVGLPGPVDVSSFWIEVPRHQLGLFCSPFEQLRQKRWHEIYWHGYWKVAEILQENRESLVHSSGYMPEEGELCARNHSISLFFRTSNDVFVFGDFD